MYFPFEKIRPIQAELLKDIELAIRSKRHLIAHAPTGLGKTAASLSAALNVALENNNTVFFLTPKHSQHAIAIETLEKIKSKYNLNINVCDLIGKKWMCSHTAIDNLKSKEFYNFCKELIAEEKCPFYNAVWGKGIEKLQPKALSKILQLKKQIWHAEKLAQEVKENFCPYEITTILGKDANVIVADYYHLFHPAIRFALFTKLKKELNNSIILIDEAHNLPSRIRSIFSESFSQISLVKAEKEAKLFHLANLSKICQNINAAFDNLTKELLTNKNEAFVEKEKLIKTIEKFTDTDYYELIDNLQEVAIEIRQKEKKSYLGSLGDFLENWAKETGPDFTRIIKRKYLKFGKKAVISVKLSCLNPAFITNDFFKTCISAILMSGTLLPGELYRDVLGLDPLKTEIKIYPSPFNNKNRLTLIETSTTTKFTERAPEHFEKIAQICAEIIKEIPHNAAVFFPSYQILESIKSYLHDKELGKKIFSDKQEFNKAQRVELLNNFKLNADNGGAVLLAVSGASFAEGIDLPGKYLEAVVIVGIPLARPDLEVQSLIDYYDWKFKRGWDYGYIYPAMTKAIQAAGRCIRTLEDRGVVVFLDKRFAWKNYLKCIPPEWKPIITSLPAERIKKFFKSK